MGKSLRLVSAFLTLALFGLTPMARAVDILTSAERTFFSPNDRTRIGIEVEFQGLSLEDAARVVREQLGGQIHEGFDTIPTTIRGYDAEGRPLYNEVKIPKWEIRDTKIGSVYLKLETNQIDDSTMAKSKNVTVELITKPITMDEIPALQGAVESLEKAGARGTSAKRAVSIQVNAEIAGGNRAEMKTKDLVNLLRSYFRPEHREQISARMQVPANRKPYVADLSPGMLERILDPTYEPSWQEFFDDYIYRQSLEVMKVPNAWTMPISEARASLAAQKNPIAPTVVKQNSLRVTSVLAFMVPEDPMSREMVESGWIKPGPYVEFREWNNDFQVSKATKQALGLLRASRDYGYFDHDRLMSELSGVEVSTIRSLRKAALKAEPTGETVGFRYFLADPTKIDRDEYLEYKDEFYRKRDIVGFLNPDERGSKPLVIPGESVVIHRRPIHADNVRGKYNPGLINAQIAQALENKYVEAKFWEEFAPGAMGRTALITELAPGESDPAKILRVLKQKYPEGWVLKGVWDLGTEDGIVTSRDDHLAAIAAYRKSDFDRFKAGIDADPRYKNAAQEYYIAALKKHPAFKGWKISEMLKSRENLIAQAMVPIDREFRVEVLGGKVLGRGSTIDRYAYKVDYDMKKAGVKPQDIRAAEEYVESLIAKLPPELRGTPFAFDVAKLKDGKWALIESNFGSNSNFLYEEDWKPSIKALTEFMEEYPKQSGKVPQGMSQSDQMVWLQRKFKEWRINTGVMYPGFAFTATDVRDREFPEKAVVEGNFQVASSSSCKDRFSKLVSAKRH